MKSYTEGCVVCGKPLVYFESEKTLPCFICGTEHGTNAACEDSHYICDTCHANKGLIFITRYALETESKNPVEIATEMMEDESINMHGPEHHYLTVAALLSAYKNAGGIIEPESALHTAMQRAKKVPGGICGMWGSCGAAIGTGIFISIITGASPLSESEWSLANKMTSLSLDAISRNGGPRCCKRDTYLALTQAVEYVRDHFGIAMEAPEGIGCKFSHRNDQCRKSGCLYFDGD